VLAWQAEKDYWINDLRPRNATERNLVLDIFFASWTLLRAQRALFERSKDHIEAAGRRADEEVAENIRKLYWDRRGPIGTYALSSVAHGGPRSSWSPDVDDPIQPAVHAKRLEGSQKGCEALIGEWQGLRHRVDQGLVLQAQDRIRAIRLMGKNPSDAALDERVNLIYVASLALHPIGRVHAYEDFKCELTTPELENFKERIRLRESLILDAQNTAKAQGALLDLIDRNLARLQAKLEVYEEHAEEYAASTAGRLAYEDTPEGERLRRYELAAQRRKHRCLEAFWKYRREMNRAEKEGQDFARENSADLSVESGVVEEASGAQNENLTTEPNFEVAASEVGTEKEVERVVKKLEWALNGLSGIGAGGIGPQPMRSIRDAKGRAAVEAAILAKGPLMRPVG
jgi:hypothetical protein